MKKIVSGLLTIAMLFSLAACTSGEKENPSPTPNGGDPSVPVSEDHRFETEYWANLNPDDPVTWEAPNNYKRVGMVVPDGTSEFYVTMCTTAEEIFKKQGYPDPAVRARSMEIMEKAIRLANRAGIRVIQLAGYDVYYEPGTAETKAFFADNLARSALLAAKYGVVLAFETMETPFMNTVAKVMEYVRGVDNPWLQVYPDVGNLTNAALSEGGDVLRDLETGRGHIAAIHLKETVPGVFREVPFGTGHVDFVSAARKAMELGVRAFVGEFWYVGSEAWEADLASANRFLRARLAEAQQ